MTKKKKVSDSARLKPRRFNAIPAHGASRGKRQGETQGRFTSSQMKI